MCYQNITSHYKAIMLFSSMVGQTNDNDFLLRLLDKPLVEQTSDAQNVLSFLMVFWGEGGGGTCDVKACLAGSTSGECQDEVPEAMLPVNQIRCHLKYRVAVRL